MMQEAVIPADPGRYCIHRLDNNTGRWRILDDVIAFRIDTHGTLRPICPTADLGPQDFDILYDKLYQRGRCLTTGQTADHMEIFALVFQLRAEQQTQVETKAPAPRKLKPIIEN